MRYATVLRSLLFSFVLLVLSQASFGQVSISVGFGPPAIPVYEQPICPGDGYIWTPGYWAYDDGGDGYYWVPGTWVLAPEPGYLWTPGYWGWGGSAFLWHGGYWGPHVGFYGGINYGFGYFGNGFEGGRWENNHFYYNTAVVHVNETIIHNTYRTTIIENNRSRVAYNGGQGGLNYRATAEQERYGSERHVEAVKAQQEHREAARANPQLRASANQGRPPIAATARPNDFHNGTVAAREAGGAYHAPPANAARGGNQNDRPANDTRKATYNHASEVQQHQYTPPNTGNQKTDQKYLQQQQKLATKQNEQHQKMQQQQVKQDQKLQQRQASEAQRQQMETRHATQTQHMEQQHQQQQTRMEQHQAPRPQGGGGHPEGGRPH